MRRVRDERFSGAGLFARLAIANQRHDCVAVTMGDPRDRTCPDVGFLTLRDAETDELLEPDTRHPQVRACLLKRRRSERNGLRAGSAARTSTASRFAPTSRTRPACRSFFGCGSGNDDRRRAAASSGVTRPTLPAGGADTPVRWRAVRHALDLRLRCVANKGECVAAFGNTIERSAEKGPVKLFVRVCAARAAVVGSCGNGRPR